MDCSRKSRLKHATWGPTRCGTINGGHVDNYLLGMHNQQDCTRSVL